MSLVISPFLPFPSISWWAQALAAGVVCFDRDEPFRKMTCRNRYHIAGAQGLIRLSIPLTRGRSQRVPMGEVRICNRDRWQTQHWRTITAAYRRSPFFEIYEHSLEELFRTPWEGLADFSFASCNWLREQLRAPVRLCRELPIDGSGPVTDLRRDANTGMPLPAGAPFPQYRQVFSERTDFIPDLSLLDLLFAEGPYTAAWITEHFKQKTFLCNGIVI
jgi:hypothetical protein